jgi:hypothetical protein
MEPEKDIFEELNEERKKMSWITKKLKSLQYWWSEEARYYPKTFKTGIKNLIYWVPVIWKDRNWDHHYIFEILKHKLSAQANYISSRGMHTRAEQDARRMRICVKLISLVQDEYYSHEHFDYHKTKHWFEDIPETPGSSFWKSKILEEKFDDYFKKYPLIYKRVLNGEGVFSREGREGNKQIIASNIGHINHERARKLLFKIMEENIEGWWD